MLSLSLSLSTASDAASLSKEIVLSLSLSLFLSPLPLLAPPKPPTLHRNSRSTVARRKISRQRGTETRARATNGERLESKVERRKRRNRNGCSVLHHQSLSQLPTYQRLQVRVDPGVAAGDRLHIALAEKKQQEQQKKKRKRALLEMIGESGRSQGQGSRLLLTFSEANQESLAHFTRKPGSGRGSGSSRREGGKKQARGERRGEKNKGLEKNRTG